MTSLMAFTGGVLDELIRDDADDLRPVPLTREQFDVLVASGALDDQRVELLEGMVVEKVTPKPVHSNHNARIAHHLTLLCDRAFGDRYLVRTGLPIAAGRWSEPEPDVSVVDWEASTDDEHPGTAHLAVEVARSSIRRDLVVKPRIYAGAGIPRYWVVDVVAREVVVHTDPYPATAGAAAGYRTVRRLPLDAELEVLGLTVRISDAVAVQP